MSSDKTYIAWNIFFQNISDDVTIHVRVLHTIWNFELEILCQFFFDFFLSPPCASAFSSQVSMWHPPAMKTFINRWCYKIFLISYNLFSASRAPSNKQAMTISLDQNKLFVSESLPPLTQLAKWPKWPFSGMVAKGRQWSTRVAKGFQGPRGTPGMGEMSYNQIDHI